MKRLWLKVILLVGLCSAALAFCTSCGGNSFEGVAGAYLNAFARFDYQTMYELITPSMQDRVPYDKFVEYHKNIYDTLRIDSVSVTRGAADDNGMTKIFHYTADFHSVEYGNFVYDMELRVDKMTKYYMVIWSPANVIEGLDWTDTVHSATLKGKRGEIFDRNGEILVQNDYAVTVYGEKEKFKDTLASASASIAQIMNADASEIQKSFEKSYGDTGVFMAVLKNKITQSQEDALLQLADVKIDRSSITPIRYYPYGQALAQTLGYSSPVSEEDRQQEAYRLIPEGTRVGRSGLELAYDSYLQPTNGKQIYLLSDDSRTKTVLYEQKQQDGLDLILTVDIRYQAELLGYMNENYLEESSGTATMIEPTTGAVVALVSYPSYDANVYAFDKMTDYGDLLTDKNTPLLNRNVQGTYPPGSIFKSMMALFGIDSKTVSQYSVFPYENQIEYYTQEKDRWRPAGSRWSNYIVRQAFRGSATGALDMHRALTWSDNIYFGWLAMKMGKEKMIQYAKKIGIGESIPFDLPVKTSQIANSLDTLNNEKLLADTGFGQAELLVTPLQLCSMFTLYGNKGTIMRPYIVQSLCSTDENGCHVEQQVTEPEVYKANVFSAADVLTVRAILENTAKNGTGKKGCNNVINTMRIAAKTGTAQTGTTDTGEVGWYAAQVISGGEGLSVLVSADESDLKFGFMRHALSLLQDQ